MRHIATVLLITSATGYLPGAVPLRWTVETSRVQPAVFDAVHGETIELEATLKSYGKPVEIDPQADWNVYWQTNGMADAWWSAPATIKESEPPSSTSTSSLHLLSATFTPAMDPGAPAVNGFIGSPGNSYRAAFTLRFRHGPGALPNALPLPTPVIDFARVRVLNPPWPPGGGCDTNTVVLTNGTLRTLGGKEITPTDVGALDESSLTPIKEDIKSAYAWNQNIYRYMTANTNAWFAGTNYVFGSDAATRRHFAWEDGMDAATVPCSMALWEIRDGVRQCVWDQRDWPTWYWSFKAQQMRHEIAATNRLIYAAIDEAVTNDSNHAWAKRYASTGRRNPDASTTFVDTMSVTLSPGMSWETVATVSGCGYWTIVGNGAVIGGSGTNATLNIKDFEGNSILEITKGQHRLAWLESNDFVGELTDSDGWICFDMMADVKPTGYFSTMLVAADFVAETDANCPAQCRWEDLGGHVWRVHFLLKPGIVSGACFAKFQVEVEGKTQIRYNADTVINGGLIFNGVKIAPVIQSGAAVGSTVTWKVVE
ncbi:MAG: hypothetical protein ACI4RD_05375 [Kiritimatiellia bacterium]